MNGAAYRTATRVWLTLLALGLPLALAQPGPPGGAPLPPGAVPPPPNGYDGDYRALEEAAKALEKAVRKAYEVGYVADARSLPYREELFNLAEGLLEGAEADFAAQTYFAAKERAKAAEDVYKTLEHLYYAEGRYATLAPPPGRGGPPPGRGRGTADLPYRVQEDLYVLERELDYYRIADGGANRLYEVARELLTQSGAEASGYGYPDIAGLGYLEAAKEALSAAHHLVKAARGF